MEKLIYSLIISISLMSCQDSTSSVKPNLGEKFEIKYGESVTIQREQISIRFNKLVEDSRCPDGVTCVWAGNAEIVIKLDDREARLNTHLRPKKANLSAYSLKLVSLNPYPEHNVDIEKEDYTAELVVTKE